MHDIIASCEGLECPKPPLKVLGLEYLYLYYPRRVFVLMDLFVSRIPDDADTQVGTIEQSSMCLDTLGHSLKQGVGLYMCHRAGGNQVGLEYLHHYYSK